MQQVWDYYHDTLKTLTTYPSGKGGGDAKDKIMFVVRDVVMRWESQPEASRSIAVAIKEAQGHLESWQGKKVQNKGMAWGLHGRSRGKAFLRDLTDRQPDLPERRRLERVAKAMPRSD